MTSCGSKLRVVRGMADQGVADARDQYDFEDEAVLNVGALPSEISNYVGPTQPENTCVSWMKGSLWKEMG
jgi:hypothetical protein